MTKTKKIIKGLVGVFTLGYLAGVLSAPKSGKNSRKQIRDLSEASAKDIEKELKHALSQTQEALKQIVRDNPKLTDNLNRLKTSAEKQETKLRNILQAISGKKNVDDDFDEILKESRRLVKEMKHYLEK